MEKLKQRHMLEEDKARLQQLVSEKETIIIALEQETQLMSEQLQNALRKMTEKGKRRQEEERVHLQVLEKNEELR